MNLVDAKEEILCNIEAGNATELVGSSGMGKSSLAYQTYLDWAAAEPQRKRGFGITFAATMSPIDDMGIPFKGEKVFTLPDGTERKITVTDPTVPLWMLSIEGKPAFCYDEFFLFIDEKDKAPPSTAPGLSEIMLSGGNGYWRLPTGSPRVAASNRGARYGSQKRFDYEIARRSELMVQGNVDITVNYLDKPYLWGGKQWQTMGVTKAWMKQHSEIVFESEPKEQGPWCSPRTACSFDRYLQVKAARNNGVIPIHNKDEMGRMTEMGAGTIGMGATTSILSTLQFLIELPQYEAVVKDPAGTPVPKKADLLMLMAYELAGRTQVPDLSAVLQYVARLPQDMCITFVQALLRRDYKNLINNPVMQAWIQKNGNLINIINALAH
jgi:hypothetical protein